MLLLDQGRHHRLDPGPALIVAIENKNLPPLVGWLLVAVAVRAATPPSSCSGYAAAGAGDLTGRPMSVVLLRVGGPRASSAGVGVYVLNVGAQPATRPELSSNAACRSSCR